MNCYCCCKLKKKNQCSIYKDMKILILGFYNRQNFGDDCYYNLFIPLIEQIIQEPYELQMMCVDDCQQIPNDINLLILGGGEILNQYFISKIAKLIDNSSFQGKVL